MLFLVSFVFSCFGICGYSFLAPHTDGDMLYAIASLAPLVYYHVSLCRKNETLTYNQIDSVYYLGFSLTVVTLLTTAVSLGLAYNGPPKLQQILLQFGLGLIATAYSLLARLHLLFTKSPDDAEKTIADAVKKIVGELDKARQEIVAFNNQTTSDIRSNKEQLEKHLAHALRVFDEAIAETQNAHQNTVQSIASTAKEFNNTISDVVKEVERIQHEAETVSFEKASEKIREFASKIESTMQFIITQMHNVLNERSGEVSDVIAVNAQAISAITNIINELRMSLDKIKQLAPLIQSMERVKNSFGSIAETVGNADAAISSLETKVSILEDNIRKMVIEPISSSHLNTALSNMEEQIKSISSTLDNFVSAMSEATVRIENTRQTPSYYSLANIRAKMPST